MDTMPTLSLQESEVLDWAAAQADSADIIIPKLILMQSNSELVAEGVATPGDFVRSTDKKVLGKNLKIIPFDKSVTWVELKLTDGRFKWMREVPYTDFNATAEWDFEEEGVPCKRQKAYNFYAYIANQGSDDAELPIIKLQFKSGSIGAGKTLADYFAKIPVFNAARKVRGEELLTPASFIWNLGVQVIKDKNIYQSFTITKGEPTPAALLAECFTWYKTVKTSKVVEHTEGTEE